MTRRRKVTAKRKLTVKRRQKGRMNMRVTRTEDTAPLKLRKFIRHSKFHHGAMLGQNLSFANYQKCFLNPWYFIKFFSV